MAEGFNGEEADDYIDALTEGMRVVDPPTRTAPRIRARQSHT